MSGHKALFSGAQGRGWCLTILLVAASWVTACAGRPLSPTPAPATALAPGDRPALDSTDPGMPLSYRTLGAAIQFEQISLQQGLSQNSVYAIQQDDQGFLWFATQDGLNRYDGYQFQVFRPEPDNPNSLSSQTLLSLYYDDQGLLWAGTNGGGLNRLDRQTGQIVHYRHDPGDSGSLNGNRVFAIAADRQGNLWVGTENGLNRLRPSVTSFDHFSHDAQDPHSLSPGIIRSIVSGQDGTLWIGSERGLDRFDEETGYFVHYRHDPADPGSLSNDRVMVVYEDREGVLWAGTYGGGLDRLDRSIGRFHHYRHDPGDPHSLSNDLVEVLYEDREGVLWIGTFGGGLNSLDRQTGQFTRYQADPGRPDSLSDNFVHSILEDRSGILWVGTMGGGINYTACTPQPFALLQANPGIENSLSDSFVWSIFQDRAGMLWIGTFDGGLNRFDRQSGRWTHYRHAPEVTDSLGDDIVRAIGQDRQGVLWVGTGSAGLDRLEPGTERFVHYRHDPNDPYSLSHDDVLALYIDAADELWIGTLYGLNRFDRASGSFVRYFAAPGTPDPTISNAVRVIYKDRSGTLWIGTEGGLHRLDRQAGQLTYRPVELPDLSQNYILSLLEDHAGTLWVGTGGSGLYRWEQKTGNLTHYGEPEGLPNSVIYGILQEGTQPGQPPGPLWLSTNQGLSRFDPQTETFVNYDVRDGLQNNEFNAGAYFKSDSGEIFFGGVNGLNSFYPSQMQPNHYLPPIVLTSLKQGGEEVALDRPVESLQQVTFRWPNNYFEFEFAALNYCQPERNQYAYKLEGFDRDWVEARTQRLGRYTNLPGKTYTLRIKGANNSGLWNQDGLALKVTVVPPFWVTWWFRGLVILVLGLGVVAGFRLRLRAVRAQSRELERQVAQRTAQLRQEMDQRFELEQALRQSEAEKAVVEERNRLARDLHDSVTQSLYAVTLYADAATRLLASGQAQPAEANLQKLRRASREALSEMRMLIFELRPPILEDGLAAALGARLEAVEGRAGVKTELHVEGAGRLPANVEEGLYRIAVEALNNALKHAQARCISVSLCLVPGATCLEIVDDGVGFELATVQKSCGLGLQGMRERAQQVGAILTVDTGPGKGTRVQVVVNGLKEPGVSPGPEDNQEVSP